jgi:hypothetical protein
LAVTAVGASDAAGRVPFLEVAVAGVAGAGEGAVWVEAGFLVKGDGEVAVVGAEDVAAVTAMVAAVEEVEAGAAFGGVAVGGSLICLLVGERMLVMRLSWV